MVHLITRYVVVVEVKAVAVSISSQKMFDCRNVSCCCCSVLELSRCPWIDCQSCFPIIVGRRSFMKKYFVVISALLASIVEEQVLCHHECLFRNSWTRGLLFVHAHWYFQTSFQSRSVSYCELFRYEKYCCISHVG